MSSESYGACSQAHQDAASGYCSEIALHAYTVFIAGSWVNVALFARLPVLFSWLFAYPVIRLWRWVCVEEPPQQRNEAPRGG
jgi:hypothetical protein